MFTTIQLLERDLESKDLPHTATLMAGNVLEVPADSEIKVTATANITQFSFRFLANENVKREKFLYVDAYSSSDQSLYIYSSFVNPLVDGYDYETMSDYN